MGILSLYVIHKWCIATISRLYDGTPGFNQLSTIRFFAEHTAANRIDSLSNFSLSLRDSAAWLGIWIIAHTITFAALAAARLKGVRALDQRYRSDPKDRVIDLLINTLVHRWLKCTRSFSVIAMMIGGGFFAASVQGTLGDLRGVSGIIGWVSATPFGLIQFSSLVTACIIASSILCRSPIFFAQSTDQWIGLLPCCRCGYSSIQGADRCSECGAVRLWSTLQSPLRRLAIIVCVTIPWILTLLVHISMFFVNVHNALSGNQYATRTIVMRIDVPMLVHIEDSAAVLILSKTRDNSMLAYALTIADSASDSPGSAHARSVIVPSGGRSGFTTSIILDNQSLRIRIVTEETDRFGIAYMYLLDTEASKAVSLPSWAGQTGFSHSD